MRTIIGKRGGKVIITLPWSSESVQRVLEDKPEGARKEFTAEAIRECLLRGEVVGCASGIVYQMEQNPDDEDAFRDVAEAPADLRGQWTTACGKKVHIDPDRGEFYTRAGFGHVRVGCDYHSAVRQLLAYGVCGYSLRRKDI